MVLNLPWHTYTFFKVIQAQLSIGAQTPGVNLSLVIQGQCVALSA